MTTVLIPRGIADGYIHPLGQAFTSLVWQKYCLKNPYFYVYIGGIILCHYQLIPDSPSSPSGLPGIYDKLREWSALYSSDPTLAYHLLIQ